MDLITTATSTEEADRGARIAVLPVGSFEQHGSHLPLSTDTVVACLIAARLAAAYDLFLLPPVTISCSHEHDGFPGTVSIGAGTLIAVVEDVRASLARAGLGRLVLVNGHGGNYVLANIAQEANVDGRQVLLFPGRDDWQTAREDAGLESSADDDMHGGEIETSILLHARPELVRPGYAGADHAAEHRPDLLLLGMAGYTATGIIGRPSLATAAKGGAVLDSLVRSFADRLKLLDQDAP